jgi:flagellar hook-associated protein 1 FlgK
MSLTSALHNASSGLSVALKAASTTSSNLANALTEGYARRELSVSARQIGGVLAGTTRRSVDPVLLSDLRLTNSDQAGLNVQTGALDRIERMLGTADDPNNLTARVTRVETALVTAIANPAQQTLRTDVVTAARDLATHLNDTARDLQTTISRADQDLAQEVDQLNQRLSQVARLNASILAAGPRDAAGLMDQRQAVIDQIAEQVPVKTLMQGNGTVALMTPKGQFLLNEGAIPVAFSTSGQLAEGAAAQPVRVLGQPLRLEGQGRIGALITLRYDIAPQALDRVRAFGVDLSERSAAAGVALFNATSTPAGVSVSDALQQDSFAASTAQAASQMAGLLDGFQAPRETAFGAVNLSTHAARLTETQSQDAHMASQKQASSMARQSALSALMAQDGVDTDGEMQNLLRIEKFFAANAKALQVLDELYTDLLRAT